MSYLSIFGRRFFRGVLSLGVMLASAVALTIPAVHAQEIEFGKPVDWRTSLSADQRVRLEAELQQRGISARAMEQVEVRVDPDHRRIELRDPSQTLSSRQAFYVGARVGLPFLLGVTLTRVGLDQKGDRSNWIDAEAATLALVSTLNAGAGKFVGRDKNWMVGARVHYLYLVDAFEATDQTRFAAGPEIGMFKKLGRKDRFVLTGRLGALILAENDPNSSALDLFAVPDAKIGISVKLGK